MHAIYCVHMFVQPYLTFSPMKVMHSHQPPTCFSEPLPSPRCSRGSVEAFRLPWGHCLYRCQLSWLEGSIENMGLQGWNICRGPFYLWSSDVFFVDGFCLIKVGDYWSLIKCSPCINHRLADLESLTEMSPEHAVMEMGFCVIGENVLRMFTPMVVL